LSFGRHFRQESIKVLCHFSFPPIPANDYRIWLCAIRVGQF
jgi:hypothetical protein